MPDQEFEYLKVEITRTESTDLYLKVPKGWKLRGPAARALLAKAAEETVEDHEWDSHDWEDTVEVQAHHVCDAEEAETYAVFDVVAALTTPDCLVTTAPSPSLHNPLLAGSGAQSPSP